MGQRIPSGYLLQVCGSIQKKTVLGDLYYMYEIGAGLWLKFFCTAGFK